jgi:hypothetical protein
MLSVPAEHVGVCPFNARRPETILLALDSLQPRWPRRAPFLVVVLFAASDCPNSHSQAPFSKTWFSAKLLVRSIQRCLQKINRSSAS